MTTDAREVDRLMALVSALLRVADADIGYAPSTSALRTELERLVADARRWQFVRDAGWDHWSQLTELAPGAATQEYIDASMQERTNG